MISRLSEYFFRTLREDPADAEFPGHKWLVRAGYIRRVAPGIFVWLPFGLRVYNKIEAIVREEMDAIGAQELRFGSLLPREPYEASHRWQDYGPTLFRLQDRKGADYLLGPTHEEFFTLIVKDLYSSYKDLPLILYHINVKYRDEARPRGGVLRCREFVMKDSYSFDVDDAGLAASYQQHRVAYQAIMDRLGLPYTVVHAMSGAMGGSRSEEFLIETDAGEDTFVVAPSGFAANVEAVRITPPPEVDAANVGPLQVVETPETPTIESLVAIINANYPLPDHSWSAADTLKNLVYKVTDVDGKESVLVVGLPGDREVDEKRLAAALEPSVAEPFADADFAAHPELVKGYIGPVKAGAGLFLGEKGSSQIKYLTDPRVVAGTRWVTGSNEVDRHQINVVFGRDFSSDGVIDVAEVRDGDPAPDGSGPLSLARGVELGHIFQLGRKYADALGLKVLDQNGKLVTVTMGSYGFGVSRAVGVIAEKTVDEKGLVWPKQVAPFDVHVIPAGKDDLVLATAEKLAEQLSEQGLEVLFDDRDVSPGVKFKDFEVIGVPTALIVGRGLANGVVEVKDRATLTSTEVKLDEAVDFVFTAAQVR
ncbi:MAG: proline--tRNA ligase [Propionibacteriaceae bacterium]|nr:proline--tRNA ligase [Propionibacteriaceae bacterium]